MTKQTPDLNPLKRSVLYVPASNSRALSKITALDADCYIIDLEDAVAPDAKEAARQSACDFLRTDQGRKDNIIIRANAIDTDWGKKDLISLAETGVKTILLPKVDHASDIKRYADIIADINIWVMIETPLGVLNAYEIASSSERIKCLVMGTSDLVKDLRAKHVPGRLPVLYSLSHSLLAARAAGVDIIDSVYLDLHDNDGFAATCKQAMEMGFDGKSVIHPKQIDVANDFFSPGTDEIDMAHKMIKAHERALSKGEGVAVLEGKLVENLHVEDAKRILNIAKLITR